ncbi:hypothetical protein NIE88_05035 [Sporolactobacillus shoreicorticis]|uniref:Uncharacterized protein n=1 Tax=Sporolactobacillus shoreicorticis TaxID=1923877 RepID=A0ABW5RYD3_9BACL|nr:hypothetical protein [Sporolactobacillus shoreicorticis]MCO7125139.1 hypothetical protein [Sporolactobacillus shoreicorticis]
MLTRADLPNLVEKALIESEGKATIVQVSKYIWKNYREELEKSGDLFFTWQYDLRWAAYSLRKKKIMKPSKKGFWELY